MNELVLRNRLGIFLILAHFGILMLVVLLWLGGYFLTDEMTSAVAIIAPFFATYTTAILRHVIAGRANVAEIGKPVTGVFAFLAFLVPGAFVSLVALAVVLKALNLGITSFENFKIMLGVAETIFGVYVGQLIFALFERTEKDLSRQ